MGCYSLCYAATVNAVLVSVNMESFHKCLISFTFYYEIVLK